MGGAKKHKLTGYHEQSKDPLNSLVLCLPILFVYEVGLMISQGSTLNGVDFITLLVARQWGVDGLLAFNGGLLLTCLVAIAVLKREERLQPKIVLPIVLESTAYALIMGSLIVLVMQNLLGLSAGAGQQLSLSERVFVSLGAGFHEELIFRLVIFGGLLWGLKKLFPKYGTAAILVALVVSSTLFSVAHYVGPEAFEVRSFVYRFLAGLMLCGLYATRGFAIAVYTHTIYDIYVLVLRG
jgi:membrane protease YdiL (CAAX protease family)